jgi:hypothetical protein
MTPNKVIERVDSVRPNSYDEELKLSWISELDGMVRHLVMGEKKVAPYKYPEDMDEDLLISFPYDDLYCLYVESMIDYYNREYDYYNNSATMFGDKFTEYKKAYIREHRAKR